MASADWRSEPSARRARLALRLRAQQGSAVSVFVAGNLMGSSASRARTRIVALTGEIGLLRLLRSILEANGCKVFPARLPRWSRQRSAFDIVIADLESFDRESLDLAPIATERRLSGAEMIAISRDIGRRIASPFWMWTSTTSRAHSARGI